MPDLRSELAEHGYVIIRRTIPRERLDGLRATFEIRSSGSLTDGGANGTRQANGRTATLPVSRGS